MFTGNICASNNCSWDRENATALELEQEVTFPMEPHFLIRDREHYLAGGLVVDRDYSCQKGLGFDSCSSPWFCYRQIHSAKWVLVQEKLLLELMTKKLCCSNCRSFIVQATGEGPSSELAIDVLFNNFHSCFFQLYQMMSQQLTCQVVFASQKLSDIFSFFFSFEKLRSLDVHFLSTF